MTSETVVAFISCNVVFAFQLDTRLNVVKTYNFFKDKDVEYWTDLLNKWFMTDKYIVVSCTHSHVKRCDWLVLM